jgi:hypothetical protein
MLTDVYDSSISLLLGAAQQDPLPPKDRFLKVDHLPP